MMTGVRVMKGEEIVVMTSGGGLDPLLDYDFSVGSDRSCWMRDWRAWC